MCLGYINDSQLKIRFEEFFQALLQSWAGMIDFFPFFDIIACSLLGSCKADPAVGLPTILHRTT